MPQRLTSPSQLRAGRALARWSARELGEKAGVSLPTIQRLERYDQFSGGTHVETLDRLGSALEGAGVVFLPNGAYLNPARSAGTKALNSE